MAACPAAACTKPLAPQFQAIPEGGPIHIGPPFLFLFCRPGLVDAGFGGLGPFRAALCPPTLDNHLINRQIRREKSSNAHASAAHFAAGPDRRLAGMAL